jgi:hypothetical protein
MVKKKAIIGLGAVVSLLLLSGIISAGVIEQSNEITVLENTKDVEQAVVIPGFNRGRIPQLQLVKQNIDDEEFEYILESMINHIREHGQITDKDINQIITSSEIASSIDVFLFAKVSGKAGSNAFIGGLPCIIGPGGKLSFGPNPWVWWDAKGHSDRPEWNYVNIKITSFSPLGKTETINSWHKGLALFCPIGIWNLQFSIVGRTLTDITISYLRSPIVFIKT